MVWFRVSLGLACPGGGGPRVSGCEFGLGVGPQVPGGPIPYWGGGEQRYHKYIYIYMYIYIYVYTQK